MSRKVLAGVSFGYGLDDCMQSLCSSAAPLLASVKICIESFRNHLPHTPGNLPVQGHGVTSETD